MKIVLLGFRLVGIVSMFFMSTGFMRAYPPIILNGSGGTVNIKCSISGIEHFITLAPAGDYWQGKRSMTLAQIAIKRNDATETFSSERLNIIRKNALVGASEELWIVRERGVELQNYRQLSEVRRQLNMIKR